MNKKLSVVISISLICSFLNISNSFANTNTINNISIGKKCNIFTAKTIAKTKDKYLKCTKVANNKFEYAEFTDISKSIINENSYNNIEDCRAPDLRLNPLPWQEIAFPIVNNTVPNKGNIKISVVLVDFNDSPGDTSTSLLIQKQMKIIDQWYSWYSNNKLSVTWNFQNTWIRANSESKNYIIPHPQSGESIPRNFFNLTNEYIQLSEKIYDFSGSDALLFVYPQKISSIVEEMNGQLVGLSSSTLNKSGTYVMTTGKRLYVKSNLLWSWIIHEVGHAMGVSGHTPSNAIMGMMHVNSGWSQALNGWDSLMLDWMDKNDLYCITKENVSNQKIKLVPAEREQIGINTVMIRLSNSKVLVVESHRPEKWAVGMKKDSLGVMTYIVDTTQSHDNGANMAKIETTARFLSPDKKMISINDWTTSDYLMLKNESLTYDGIKITLVYTGSNDTIKIEKVLNG
jgi:hypothetical protein